MGVWELFLLRQTELAVLLDETEVEEDASSMSLSLRFVLSRSPE